MRALTAGKQPTLGYLARHVPCVPRPNNFAQFTSYRTARFPSVTGSRAKGQIESFNGPERAARYQLGRAAVRNGAN